MRKVLALAPLAAFVALAAYLALALGSGRDPQALPSALIDKPVPAFDLPALDGGPGPASTALPGKVLVINFFASWCVPCRLEHPLLMRLAEREKLTIWGIAYKDKPEDARRLLGQLGDPYARIGLDREGRTALDFGLYGVPESYVIDAAGHIRKRFVGPLTPETMERELLPLVHALAR